MSRAALVVILLASILALAKGTYLNKIEQDCVSKTKSDFDFIKKHVYNQTFLLDRATCYMACIMEHNGTIQRRNKKLNVDKFIKKIPRYNSKRNDIIKAIKSCAKPYGKTWCDRHVSQIKCLRQNKLIQSVKELRNTGLARPK